MELVAHNKKLHDRMDDAKFTLRLQTFVKRDQESVAQLFAELVVAAEAVRTYWVLVGINLVSDESHPAALQNYWLQMQVGMYLVDADEWFDCAHISGEVYTVRPSQRVLFALFILYWVMHRSLIMF